MPARTRTSVLLLPPLCCARQDSPHRRTGFQRFVSHDVSTAHKTPYVPGWNSPGRTMRLYGTFPRTTRPQPRALPDPTPMRHYPTRCCYGFQTPHTRADEHVDRAEPAPTCTDRLILGHQHYFPPAYGATVDRFHLLLPRELHRPALTFGFTPDTVAFIC